MGASSSYSYIMKVDRLLLLPLNGDVVPHLPLLVLLSDLLNDWCEVSTVLHCQLTGDVAVQLAYLLRCGPLLLW